MACSCDGEVGRCELVLDGELRVLAHFLTSFSFVRLNLSQIQSCKSSSSSSSSSRVVVDVVEEDGIRWKKMEEDGRRGWGKKSKK